jgi:hypothetical protein
MGTAGQPVSSPVMGAIRPWHIAALCCCITPILLIGGGVWYYLDRRSKRR